MTCVAARLGRMLIGLTALVTLSALEMPSGAAASGSSLPPTASVPEIVNCAEARHRYNLRAFSGYSVRVNSIRQGYSTDGKLEENYKVVKTVKVNPKGREEQFERGEKNGKSASADDFWLEKLGMSKKYNAEAMNLFAPEAHGRYDFIMRGPEQLRDGRAVWKLAFKVKTEGNQEMQKGHVWIDQATCGVIRAEGNFPKVWVTQDVRAELALTEVRPGLWLPARQEVDLTVTMPLMKRKAKMIDEFTGYQVQESR